MCFKKNYLYKVTIQFFIYATHYLTAVIQNNEIYFHEIQQQFLK